MSARSRPSASIKLPAGVWKEWKGAERKGERGGGKEEGGKRRGKRGGGGVGIFFWH